MNLKCLRYNSPKQKFGQTQGILKQKYYFCTVEHTFKSNNITQVFIRVLNSKRAKKLHFKRLTKLFVL